MSKININEILENESFIRWAKGEKVEEWDEFIEANPDKKEEILKAKSLLQNFLEEIKIDELTIIEKEILWENINNTIKEKENISKTLRKIAAVILPLIFLSIIFYSYNKIFYRLILKKEIKYVSTNNNKTNKVTLITTNNKIENIQATNSIIIYNNNGETNINHEKILKQNIIEKKTGYNKVIVPYGKRCEIIFSDGSKMYLNSGSIAIYPICFDKKSRELYIEGEAFFEVKHNQEWPFIAKTKNMTIEVLGTTFNLTSYNDEKNIKVVLVEGKVKVSAKLSKKYILEPGNLLTFNKVEKKVSIEKVDVTEYISWKEGWMLCKNENLVNILKRLSRYYNISFEYSEEDLSILKLTGKLDLKDNIIKVLETISNALPINYFKVENNKIAIIRDESKN